MAVIDIGCVLITAETHFYVHVYFTHIMSICGEEIMTPNVVCFGKLHTLSKCLAVDHLTAAVHIGRQVEVHMYGWM